MDNKISKMISSKKISTENPILSICIPTYNRYSLLKKSIMSVYNQIIDLKKIEIIISDNNSKSLTDQKEVIELLNALNINYCYYYCDEDLTMFGNWNRTFYLSDSQYTMLLHDDDLLLPHACSDLLYIMQRDTEIDCLIPKHYVMENNILKKSKNKSLIKIIGHSCMSNKIYKYPTCLNYFTCTMGYGCPGTIFKKGIVEKNGYFDIEDYPYADWTFFIKLNEKFNVYRLENYTAVYRYEVNAGLQKNVRIQGYQVFQKIMSYFESEKLYGKIFSPFIHNAQENYYYALSFGEWKKAKRFSDWFYSFVLKTSKVIFNCYILLTSRRVG